MPTRMTMPDIRLVLANGETIVATEHNVESATTTALILHGYFSTRQSANTQAAITGFAQQGYNVVAPDFYGRGDSDGAFGDLTIAKGVATAAAAVAHITQRDPAQRIILIGGSFGGLVAMQIAAQFADSIALLILRAPVSDWKAVWDNDLTPDQFALWDRDGSFSAPMPWGETVTFSRAVYDEMLTSTLYQTVAPRITAPTLIVHGTQDDVVPLAQSETLNNVINNSNLIVIEGADHAFSRPDDLAAYQSAVAAFIAAQQT